MENMKLQTHWQLLNIKGEKLPNGKKCCDKKDLSLLLQAVLAVLFIREQINLVFFHSALAYFSSPLHRALVNKLVVLTCTYLFIISVNWTGQSSGMGTTCTWVNLHFSGNGARHVAVGRGGGWGVCLTNSFEGKTHESFTALWIM